MLLSDRHFSNRSNYVVRTLHAGLTMEEQNQAFESPPSNIRKIVLSTNIAETGVTIPDVVFVIDTLSVKEVRYNESTRVSSLVKCLVPQSSAEQRRGRAGRVREGFCFRLVTHDTFAALHKELTPEMLRVPLTDMCLNVLVTQMKITPQYQRMTPEKYLALALDPPDPKAIAAALTTLEEVGAVASVASTTSKPHLEEEQQVAEEAARTIGAIRIEPLGFLLANIPADVKIGKILIMGAIMKCLRPSLIVAASLAYKTPFVTPMEKRTEAAMARREFHRNDAGKPLRSDHLAIVNAYTLFASKLLSKKIKAHALKHWCRTKFLSYQILSSMKDTIVEFEGYLTAMGFLPTATKERGQIMDTHANKPCVVLAALSSGLWPNVATITRSSTSSGTLPIIAVQNKIAAIHPSSINFKISTDMLLSHTNSKSSGFLCYHDLMQTSKCYLRDTSVVSAACILLLCGNGSDASVVFGKQKVIVHGWIQISITSKAAVLIIQLRKRLNAYLLQKVAHPSRIETKEDRELSKMMARLLEV